MIEKVSLKFTFHESLHDSRLGFEERIFIYLFTFLFIYKYFSDCSFSPLC